MSADNWTICPKCKTNKEDAKKKARLEAEKSYGKITPGEFLSLMNDISSNENKEQERTLREDYEIGMDEYGSFSINYSAICGDCGFKYKYDYVVSIPLTNKPNKK